MGVGSYAAGGGGNSSRAGCLEFTGAGPAEARESYAALNAVRLESVEEARCWVATVAHDFNNLLAAIGLNCDRIVSDAADA